MSKDDLSKIKGQTPISIIVHGGNYISFLLAQTLLEQGSHVVIIDRYTNNSKHFFSQLKKTGKVTFIDFKGLKNFYEKVARIDYLYYMLGEKVQSTDKIDSKDFLSETDFLNSSLSAANKYKAKISLVTSLRLNRELSNVVNSPESGKTKPYSPLELQRYGENYAAEFVDKSKANLRIVRLGTVVGKGINQIPDLTLDKLFTDATQKHQIEIDGEGLEVHNLIHESDAIYGILKLTFAESTTGEVISLCNKNDYTTLSLAYKLLELDVEAKAIKFVETQNSDVLLQDLYIPAPNATQFGWKQNITLEESTIDQVQAYYEKSDKKWDINKTEGPIKSKAKENISSVSKTKLGEFVSSLLKPFKKISKPEELFKQINYLKIVKNVLLVVFTFFLIYYLIAPLFGISLGSFLVYNQGRSLKEAISELDFEEIESNSQNISKNIIRVEDNFNRLSWISRISGTQEYFANISQVVQGTKYVSESTQDLVLGLRPLGEYIKDYEPNISSSDTDSEIINDYSDYLNSMEENRYALREGIYKMSLAQNLINSVDTRKFPKFARDFVLEYKDLITETNNVVKPLERISLFLPDLLGVEERKRYLILLQDNAEIRSTGGIITNFAVVAIEGGQIRELFVDDVFNAQATLYLKGYTYRTPNSLVRALQDTTFSFPLVNWNPNLDSTLLSSEQFIYDLGKGNSLDGIIAIDMTFLQKLLDVWGGIEVPGETELITAENLYPKVFEITPEQSSNSPSSSTFLTDFFDSVVTKFFSSRFSEYKDLYPVFTESLEQKSISITFKNSIAKSYFNDNGWDCNIDSKYLTTPVSIDWNWGNNKANLYTKKTHTLSIKVVDENTIDYTYKIGIQNDSTQNQYPEGDYINYARVFLPFDATVTGIKGYEENRYDLYEEAGYKVVGGWFNIPVRDTKILEISYRLSREKDTTGFVLQKSDSHYELDIHTYKQPGSKKDSYNLSVTYPIEWTTENIEGLTIIENSATKRFELSSNQSFFISWQR